MIQNVLRRSPVFAFLALLAVQLAVQPFLVKAFTSPRVSKASIVAACEFCKIIIAIFFLQITGAISTVFKTWTLRESLVTAGLPGIIYAFQNVCLQFAYSYLSPTNFQLINQTKVFWSVLFGFIILGHRQTKIQCVSIGILVCGSTIAVLPTSSSGGSSPVFGAPFGIAAAVLSGLASTISQWTLQNRKRNVFLFGGEMAVYTIISLIANAAFAQHYVFFSLSGWTWATLIPIFTAAVGGLLVGLVTERAGNIAKGYAIVTGIVMTGFLENMEVPFRLWVALLLVVGSILLRLYFP